MKKFAREIVAEVRVDYSDGTKVEVTATGQTIESAVLQARERATAAHKVAVEQEVDIGGSPDDKPETM